MNQNWDEMGEHLILDVYDGYFDDLNSPNFLRDIFTRAILKSEMTILNEYTHKFNPCGVTGLLHSLKVMFLVILGLNLVE